jgi:hypothetical protein
MQFPDGLTITTDAPELFTNAKRVSATIGKAAKRQYAIDHLRPLVLNVDTLYTTLVSVSRSGMQRRIKLLVVNPEGQIQNVSGWAADALGWRQDDESMSVVVDGAGMDMGFHLVDTLGRVLEMSKLGHRWI